MMSDIGKVCAAEALAERHPRGSQRTGRGGAKRRKIKFRAKRLRMTTMDIQAGGQALQIFNTPSVNLAARVDSEQRYLEVDRHVTRSTVPPPIAPSQPLGWSSSWTSRCRAPLALRGTGLANPPADRQSKKTNRAASGDIRSGR